MEGERGGMKREREGEIERVREREMMGEIGEGGSGDREGEREGKVKLGKGWRERGREKGEEKQSERY